MTQLITAKEGGFALPESGSLLLRAGEQTWQESGSDGFWVKSLMEDPESGQRTWLMKVDAGAFSPSHAHEEVEQIYVLEGSFYDQDASYGPGDFIVRAPGATHTSGSKSGAVVLLFYSPAA
jgi:anti-sigma factor ChrR (cupin superfamily)